EQDVVAVCSIAIIGVDAQTGNDGRPRRLQQGSNALKVRVASYIVAQGIGIDAYDGYGADSYDVLLWEFRRDLNAYLSTLANPLNQLSLDEIIRFNDENADRELKRFDQSIFLRSQALKLTEDAYREKRERTRTAMRAEGLDRLFEENRLDALIGVSTSVGWLIDWVNGDASFGRSMAGPAAVAGNPHITLPLAEIEGLPHGISLIGERWKDHRLAAIAAPGGRGGALTRMYPRLSTH
ncbi:MAG: glutamyl-tRNA amidotransferase, partial [Pseudomonadota bacterium]